MLGHASVGTTQVYTHVSVRTGVPPTPRRTPADERHDALQIWIQYKQNVDPHPRATVLTYARWSSTWRRVGTWLPAHVEEGDRRHTGRSA